MRITLRENKNALKLFKNTLNKRLIKLGKAVIHDAVHQAPMPPIRTGFLRGSHFIFTESHSEVSNPSIKTNRPSFRKPSNTVNTELVLLVGFYAPYATKMHNEWTQPEYKRKVQYTWNSESGRYFLTSKVKRYKNSKYKEILEGVR